MLSFAAVNPTSVGAETTLSLNESRESWRLSKDSPGSTRHRSSLLSRGDEMDKLSVWLLLLASFLLGLTLNCYLVLEILLSSGLSGY